MIYKLRREHHNRIGAPHLSSVDSEIFELCYFQPCLVCSHCEDHCCEHGADVDLVTFQSILKRGYSGAQCFTGDWVVDPDYPGGKATRTRIVHHGARLGCVFLAQSGRGCSLHARAKDLGLDYHAIKPMVCALFPVTFDNGLLRAADEVRDGTVACAGEGVSLYTGSREELRYYFGDGLIDELDELQRRLEIPR